MSAICSKITSLIKGCDKLVSSISWVLFYILDANDDHGDGFLTSWQFRQWCFDLFKAGKHFIISRLK